MMLNNIFQHALLGCIRSFKKLVDLYPEGLTIRNKMGLVPIDEAACNKRVDTMVGFAEAYPEGLLKIKPCTFDPVTKLVRKKIPKYLFSRLETLLRIRERARNQQRKDALKTTEEKNKAAEEENKDLKKSIESIRMEKKVVERALAEIQATLDQALAEHQFILDGAFAEKQAIRNRALARKKVLPVLDRSSAEQQVILDRVLAEKQVLLDWALTARKGEQALLEGFLFKDPSSVSSIISSDTLKLISKSMDTRLSGVKSRLEPARSPSLSQKILPSLLRDEHVDKEVLIEVIEALHAELLVLDKDCETETNDADAEPVAAVPAAEDTDPVAVAAVSSADIVSEDASPRRRKRARVSPSRSSGGGYLLV
jgi:hypothetical protein